MERSIINQWLKTVLGEIDSFIYEREQDFVLSLLVVLSGNDLVMIGESGVGKTFFKKLLIPIASSFPVDIIESNNDEKNYRSIRVSSLQQENSFIRLVNQRAITHKLTLPNFSLKDTLIEIKKITLRDEIVDSVLKLRKDLGWSAQEWMFFIDLLATSAYYNQRSQVDWSDLLICHVWGVPVLLCEDVFWRSIDEELHKVEKDLDVLLSKQQGVRKVRQFPLTLKGETVQACRFLYRSEESYLLLSAYQQLYVQKEYCSNVTFYQPSGYGLEPTPFREDFKLLDLFTLVDLDGNAYELLTEQVLSMHNTYTDRTKLIQRVDDVLYKMFEYSKSEMLSNIFIFNINYFKIYDGNVFIQRIEAIKAKL